ncbi:MAG: CAP domain-containing protein [Actinobacteria bacterium]|nr:CAP domain-containing protein [Actinomycetota bacterium]
MASPVHHRTGRRASTAALVIVVAALLSACLGPAQSQVQRELNADRTAHKLRALPINYDAQAKAQAWAEKLARERKLYHSRLTDNIHVKWCSLGENIGYGPSVASIEDAYMNSPAHRANILASKWNGVGVGYAKNGNRVYTVHVFIKTC